MRFVEHSDLRFEIFLSSLSVFTNAHEVQDRWPTVHAEKEEEVVLGGDNNKENAGGFQDPVEQIALDGDEVSLLPRQSGSFTQPNKFVVLSFQKAEYLDIAYWDQDYIAQEQKEGDQADRVVERKPPGSAKVYVLVEVTCVEI